MKMKKRFTVEITNPCGRAGYDGGETVLHADGKRYFGVGPFMAAFPEVKTLRDGDEVEVTIEVAKK
jgi:hypothetical protein